MKRILITGGAGFLGSHLCTKLLEKGNEVLCVDNFQNLHFRTRELVSISLTWALPNKGGHDDSFPQ